ncbi:MAG: ribosomal-protein-alanine N-acetyltransferase [Flavobacterium sp.]|jgi:ribosomal-protein-alanine N-acetyltransferase
MIKNLIIREYTSNDKDKVLAILKLNVPKYFAKSEIDDFENYLTHKIEKYFVAAFGGEIIGAGGINFDDNSETAKISWGFIDTQFKGIGIGQSLLKYRIDFIKSNYNAKTIKVRTSQLAYKFYEKNGFTLKKIEKDYWAAGFDLYSMSYE